MNIKTNSVINERLEYEKTDEYTPSGMDIYQHLDRHSVDADPRLMRECGRKSADADIFFDEEKKPAPNTFLSKFGLDDFDHVILLTYQKASMENRKMTHAKVSEILNISRQAVTERIAKIKANLPSDRLQLLGIA
jgi:hypothetical protein